MNQRSYTHLIRAVAQEALCRPQQAIEELRPAAKTDDLWSRAARAILERASPVDYLAWTHQSQPGQVMEALLLIAEFHRHAGNEPLARKYYEACLRHIAGRAMIRRIAQARIVELQL